MIDNARKEKVKLNVLSDVESQQHFHHDIELIYILEGSLDIEFPDRTVFMQSEDVFVINANKKHMLKGSSNLLYMQLMISYALFSDMFNSADIIFWCDSTKDESERYDELRKTLKSLLNHYLERHGEIGDFGHISLCYRVLDIMSMYFLVRSTDKENTEDQNKFEERIAQINNYIRANYNQPISLKDLAEKLYLSNGYLSRFFKRNYGMSFAEYLTNIRLFHAVDDLLYSNVSITKIAYDNGFANVAVFNKMFKKVYGETPSVARKKNEQKIEEKKMKNPEIEDRLEKYLIVENENSDEEKNSGVYKVVCNTSKSELMKALMGKTVNIGVASELLNSEIQAHVLILKQALNFRYVRFWNIFTKDMLIDLENTENYNFSRLDSVIDFLLSTNLKPHIDFSMKAKMLLYNPQDVKYFDESEDKYLNVEFTATDVWEHFMEAFMQHIIRRYGRDEVDTWRCEYWFNEGKRQEEFFETYLNLFDITYHCVKKYSEGMEVGGCGFRLDLGDDLSRTLVHLWKEKHCIPDFFSAYIYHYVRGKDGEDRYAKKSSDNEFFIHKIQSLKGVFAEYGLENVKLYITEWNVSPSVRNYVNDTCFKGAYLIKNALDAYGQVDDVAYYMGTDRSQEYFDSNELLFGGCGLITKDSIMKPAGFALDFMSRLYPYCVDIGEHYIVTTEQHDAYGIVCHNQRTLGYNYFFTKENELEKEHFWKYYEDRNDIKINFELENVTPGTYQVKSYRINEKNGSIMSIWQETEFEKDLSRNDIKYFRRMCEPKLTIQKLVSEDGKLYLSTELMANEILFVRVRKLF